MDFATQLKRDYQAEWKTAYLDYEALWACAAPPRVGRLPKRQKQKLVEERETHDPERQPLLDGKQDITFGKLYATEVDRVNDFYEKKLEETRELLDQVTAQYKVFREHKKAAQSEDDGLWKKIRRLTRRKTLEDDWYAAKEDLKFSTFVVFRKARLLAHFAKLNETGFRETAALCEGGLESQLGRQSIERLENAAFSKRRHLKHLSERIKENYADHFTDGNRLNALKELYPRRSGASHHFALWRAGLLAGFGIACLLAGLRHSLKIATHSRVPNWAALLQVYSALLLPVLLGMLLVIDLAVWQRFKLNFVLVFDFDRRTFVGNLVFAEIPAAIFAFFSILFWLSWQKHVEEFIPATTFPLIFMAGLAAWLFLPLPILWPSARWWAIRSTARMLSSGLLDMQFRDFWLGDMLTSVSYSVSQIGFIICAYKLSWKGDINSQCSPSDSLWTPVLIAIPYLIRALQSLRRYFDLKKKIQLLNVLKGAVSISYYIVYYAWRRHGSNYGKLFVLWLVFGLANSVYSGLWDILVDWNMDLRPGKGLRPHEKGMVFPKPTYYAAIVANSILRFAWLIYLLPFPSDSVQGVINALLEVSRRILWNMYRLEAEQVGNLDSYKAVTDVRLPYDLSKS